MGSQRGEGEERKKEEGWQCCRKESMRRGWE